MKKVRFCKICKKELPITREYCKKCHVKLRKEGRPPIHICKECGEAYGEEKVQKGLKQGESTQWREGKCDICDKKKPLVHYRHYGYLTRGHLAKAIDKEKVWEKLEKKS